MPDTSIKHLNEAPAEGQLMTDEDLLERGYYTISLRQIAQYLQVSSRIAQEFVSRSEVSCRKMGTSCLKESICRRAGVPHGTGSRNCNLYRNDEVFARLKDCTTTYVETIRVPMSFFSDDPAEFRRLFLLDFIEDRRKRDSAFKRLRVWVGKDMPKWKCLDRISPYGAEQLFAFKQDVLDYAYEQGEKRPTVLDSKLPRVKLQLPDIFPFFESQKSFGERSITAGPGSSTRTVNRLIRRIGGAIHEIKFKGDYESSTPRELLRYTDGLLLGDQRHWPDYLIGATVPMTALRAQKLFGEQFGKHWMFTSKNVRTQGDLPYSDWTIGAANMLKLEVPQWYRTETDLRKLNYHV